MPSSAGLKIWSRPRTCTRERRRPASSHASRSVGDDAEEKTINLFTYLLMYCLFQRELKAAYRNSRKARKYNKSQGGVKGRRSQVGGCRTGQGYGWRKQSRKPCALAVRTAAAPGDSHTAHGSYDLSTDPLLREAQPPPAPSPAGLVPHQEDPVSWDARCTQQRPPRRTRTSCCCSGQADAINPQSMESNMDRVLLL